jgi:hypothetical protein
VIAIWAVTQGYMDDIPVDAVRRFETELIEHMHARHPDVVEHLRSKGTLDGIEDTLRQGVEEFKGSFSGAGQERAPARSRDSEAASDGSSGESEARAESEGDGQEAPAPAQESQGAGAATAESSEEAGAAPASGG